MSIFDATTPSRSVLLIAFLLFAGHARAATYQFPIAALTQEESTTQRILPSNIYQRPVLGYTNPSFVIDLMAKGVDLVQAKLNALGGSIIGSDRLLYNITWFNVAPASANTTYVLAQTQALMHDIVDLQRYGRFQAIISFSSTDIVNAVVSLKCEETQTCIVLYPVQSDPAFFACSGQYPDCAARNVGARRFDSSFAMLSAPQDDINDFFKLIKSLGARTMSYVAENSTFGAAAIQGALANAASLNLTILYGTTLPAAGVPTLDDGLSVMRALLAHGEPDVFVLYASPGQEPICQNLVQAMHEINWVPKAFMNDGPCTVSAEPELQLSGTGATTRYSFYGAPWDVSLTGQSYHAVATAISIEAFPSTLDNDSPQLFAQDMLARFQGLADNIMTLSVLGAACLIAIQKAVEATQSATPTHAQLVDAMLLLNQPSVIGQLGFDDTGRLFAGSRCTAQIVGANSAYQLVTPTRIGSATIYPAPSYDERVESVALFGSDAITTGHLTLICFLIASRFLLMPAVWRYSGHLLIREKDLTSLCMIIAIGVFESATMLPWTAEATETTCRMRMFLPIVPLLCSTSALSGLAVALSRLRSNQTLFRLRTLYRVQMSGGAALLALVLGMIISGAWLASPSALTAVPIEPDPIRPSTFYYECDDESGSNNTAPAVMVYVALFGANVAVLLSFVGRYHADPTRLPFATFATAVVLRVGFMGLYWPLSLIVTTDPHALLLCRTLLYFIMSLTFDFCLFWLPVYTIHGQLARATPEQVQHILKLSNQLLDAGDESSTLNWKLPSSQMSAEDSLPGETDNRRAEKKEGEPQNLSSASGFVEHLTGAFKAPVRRIPWLQLQQQKVAEYVCPLGFAYDLFESLTDDKAAALIFEALDDQQNQEYGKFLYAFAIYTRIFAHRFHKILLQDLQPTELSLMFLTKPSTGGAKSMPPKGKSTSAAIDTASGEASAISLLDLWTADATLRLIKAMLPFAKQLYKLFLTSNQKWEINIYGEVRQQLKMRLHRIETLMQLCEKSTNANVPETIVSIDQSGEEEAARAVRVTEARDIFLSLFAPILAELGRLIRGTGVLDRIGVSAPVATVKKRAGYAL